MIIDFMKLDKEAMTPTYATDGSACFDFYALDMHVLYNQTDSDGELGVLIGTGLAVAIPEGYCMKIYSRSGHGFKNSIRLANCVGVIDSDYRGEIKIALVKDFVTAPGAEIKKGSRIAQGMMEKVDRAIFHEVTMLTDTKRGTGGMGSTGL